MDTKECKKCGLIQDINQYTKARDTKDKLNNRCKSCVKKYNVNYNINRQIEISEYNKLYKNDPIKKEQIKIHNDKPEIKVLKKEYSLNHYLNNKESKSLYQKGYLEKNPDYMKNYFRTRCNNDPLFKLTLNIRTLIYIYLKGNKSKKTKDILGCTYEEFKIYLESKFESWMNWNNYGKYNGTYSFGWDIDHIIPMSSAITKEELIKLNHFSNLQPLCSKINREIKRDKLNYGG